MLATGAILCLAAYRIMMWIGRLPAERRILAHQAYAGRDRELGRADHDLVTGTPAGGQGVAEERTAPEIQLRFVHPSQAPRPTTCEDDVSKREVDHNGSLDGLSDGNKTFGTIGLKP